MQAHNPAYSIYIFDENTHELTIRTTTLSLIDILMNKGSLESKDGFLDLQKFAPLIAPYFNETISFRVNDKAVADLVLKNTYFDSHEAILIFRLELLPDAWENVDLSLTSFTEVYRKPSNFVIVRTGNKSHETVLGKNVTTCSFHSLKDSIPQEARVSSKAFGYLGLVALLAMLMGFVRKHAKESL